MFWLILFILISILLIIFTYIKATKNSNKIYFGILVVDSIFLLTLIFTYAIKKEVSVASSILAGIFCFIIPTFIFVSETLGYDLIEFLVIIVSKIYIKRNKVQKAENLIYSYLEKNPYSFNIHKKLAKTYLIQGALRKALDEYIIAINIEEDIDSYLQIARIYCDLNKEEEAIKALDYILSKNPDDEDILRELAEIYLVKNNFKLSLKLYDKVLAINPSNADALFKKACINIVLNNFGKAKLDLIASDEIKKNKLAKLYIAQIELIENDIEKSVELFKELLDDEKYKPYVLYELARIAVYKEQESKAVSYINEAVKLKPYLYKRAMSDDIFYNIKNYFVKDKKLEELIKTDERQRRIKKIEKLKKEISENEEIEINLNKMTNKIELENKQDKEENSIEIQILYYLSNTSSLINKMSDKYQEERITKKVDEIFRQKYGEQEVEEILRNEQQDEIK